MSRISRKTLLVKLPTVEAIDKQAQGTLKRMGTARETPRRAGQASQVMPQLSIVGFDGIGVAFAFRDCVAAPVIPQAVIGRPGIAVVVFGLGRCVDQRLNGWLRTFPDHLPAQIAAGLPVDQRQDVDPVFLWPMKVNTSSISATWTSSGKGAAGKWAA